MNFPFSELSPCDAPRFSLRLGVTQKARRSFSEFVRILKVGTMA